MTPAPIPDEGAREAEIQRWFALNEWVELNCSSVITDRLDDLTTELAEARRELARANAVIERVGAEVLLSADDVAIDLAHDFHLRYEEMAPEFGYVTNPRTAVPWEDLPADNKALMLAVAKRIWLDFVDVPLRTILEGNGA